MTCVTCGEDGWTGTAASAWRDDTHTVGSGKCANASRHRAAPWAFSKPAGAGPATLPSEDGW